VRGEGWPLAKGVHACVWRGGASDMMVVVVVMVCVLVVGGVKAQEDTLALARSRSE